MKIHQDSDAIWLLGYDGILTAEWALSILAMEYDIRIDPEEYECSIMTHRTGFDALTNVVFRKRSGEGKDS